MSETTLMVSVIGPGGTGDAGPNGSGTGATIVTRAVGPGGAWIGRSAACEILVDDPQRHVSLRHCRIDSADGGFWVTDLSTNGTFLNDSQAPLPKGQRQALAAGDRLRVGTFLIAFDPPAPDVIQPGPSLVATFADAPASPLLDPAWALPTHAPGPGDRGSDAPHDDSADSLGALLADLLPNPTPAAGIGAAGTGVGGFPATPSPPPPPGTSHGSALPMFAPPPPAPVERSLLEEADPFSLLPSPVLSPPAPSPPAPPPPAPPPPAPTPGVPAQSTTGLDQTVAWQLPAEPPVAPPLADARPAPPETPAATPSPAPPADPIAAALDPTTTAVDELVSALASEIVRQPPSSVTTRPQDVEVYAPDRAGSAATRALAAFWCGLGIMPKGLDPASLATVMMDLGAALREATDGFAAMTAAANRASNDHGSSPPNPAAPAALAGHATPPGPAAPHQGPFANGHADLRRLIEDRDASTPRLDELVRAVFAAAAEREDFQAAGVRTALHRALRSMTASAVQTRFGALLRGRREATRRAELIDLMFKMEAELIELAETHFRRELADAMQARIGRRISFGGPRR